MSPQVPQVTAHTTSDKGGISVDIVDGVGTVSYEGRGPIPAFLYSAVPWDFIDRTLYAGMGIADGVWYPFWLYCSDDGRLTDFDGEMSDSRTSRSSRRSKGPARWPRTGPRRWTSRPTACATSRSPAGSR
jgi:hypothetical protein